MTPIHQWMVTALLGASMMAAGIGTAQAQEQEQDKSAQQEQTQGQAQNQPSQGKNREGQQGAMGQQQRSLKRQPHEKLVRQCLDLGIQKQDEFNIDGLEVESNNSSDYQPGHEYPLKINLRGPGNTTYIVHCQVDKDGKPHYDGVVARGQPAE